jgi:peptidoglycan/xylan/chitin deacetylase (PgdA/CDA1 family)
MHHFPILMYHRIESDQCPVCNDEELRYAVPTREFEWQIDFIKREGLRCLTVREAALALRNEKRLDRSVVLSFDDGNRSDYVHVMPLLREVQFRGTFFITVERIGRPDGLEAVMIKELSRASMEIGSHGMTHRFLTSLPEKEQFLECEASGKALGEIIGTKVSCFSPPGGRMNRKTRVLLKRASYDTVCTSSFGFVGRGTDLFSLPRIPITRGTNRDTFRSIIRAERLKLFPMYVRFSALQLLRCTLGESLYRRSRSRALRT